MYEVFKRVVNNEDLSDLVTDSTLNLDGSLTDRQRNEQHEVVEKKEHSEYIPNYKTPSIRA